MSANISRSEASRFESTSPIRLPQHEIFRQIYLQKIAYVKLLCNQGLYFGHLLCEPCATF